MARPEGPDRARTLRLVRAHILRLAGRFDGGREGRRPREDDDEDDPEAEAADEGPDDEGPRPAA
jgi:hypothetical protein